MSRMTRFVTIVVLLLTLAPARADWLEVRRNANLKVSPESEAARVVKLDPGMHLELLSESQTNGYYNAKTSDGQSGWVYRTLVKRHTDDQPPSDHAPNSISAKLEIHVIDVGQGDAILIRCPEGAHELLIDAADSRYTGSGRQFKDYMGLHQNDDNPIEVVVATHPHADHIGNMAWVLDTYPVTLYVDNGNIYSTATYNRVEIAFAGNGCGYWSAQDEEMAPMIDFCPREDVDARVLRTSRFGEHGDPNDNSVIVRVDFGEMSFLFVGDAEEHAEAELLADEDTKDLLDCDFLKVGHHGSATSSSDSFLAAVTPQVAAISCGAKGVSTNAGYKHPRFERVNAILSHVGPREGGNAQLEAYESNSATWKGVSLNKALYVTTVDGDLVFECDGNSIHRRQ